MIKLSKINDLIQLSYIHKIAFPNQQKSYKWLECIVNAYPKNMLFFYEIDEKAVAYINWSQKSGFREEAVLELEQIAVLPEYQNQGIATTLIFESLDLVKEELEKQNSILKSIVVTTRHDNHAIKLYEKTLGVQVESVIKNLYSADEVVMVKRFI